MNVWLKVAIRFLFAHPGEAAGFIGGIGVLAKAVGEDRTLAALLAEATGTPVDKVANLLGDIANLHK